MQIVVSAIAALDASTTIITRIPRMRCLLRDHRTTLPNPLGSDYSQVRTGVKLSGASTQ